MNDAVLTAMEEHVLTPETVEQVVLLTERSETQERKQVMEKEG